MIRDPRYRAPGGTIPTFNDEVRYLVRSRVTDLSTSIATGFGAQAQVDFSRCFDPLRNSDVQAEAAMAVARELVRPLAELDDDPKSGSEGFANMLAVVPAAYGQGDGRALHNPGYDFDDDATSIGASLLARIAECRAAASSRR